MAVLENSLLVPVIRQLLSETGLWSGTASDLLAEFQARSPDAGHDRAPKSARTIGTELNEIAHDLRQAGIDVRKGKQSDRKRTRLITIVDTARQAGSPEAETDGSDDVDSTDEVSFVEW